MPWFNGMPLRKQGVARRLQRPLPDWLTKLRGLTTLPVKETTPSEPIDPGVDIEAFMSTTSIVPKFPTGLETEDQEVGWIYVDTTGNYQVYALLGSGSFTAGVTLKAKNSDGTTLSTLTVTGQRQKIGPSVAFSVPADSYVYFTLACENYVSSWDCPVISLKRSS